MMRFQLPPRPESLNHIPMPCVNNLSQKLIDDKLNGTIGSYAGKEINRFQKRFVIETEFDQAEADAQESIRTVNLQHAALASITLTEHPRAVVAADRIAST
jgi:hypothetical protein